MKSPQDGQAALYALMKLKKDPAMLKYAACPPQKLQSLCIPC
jgi:hypothetical protein